jgi:hypothetical protein
MSEKLHTLDVKALLKKNPKAANVFKSNRKKLSRVRHRPPKEYGLGLPYERLLASSKEGEERAEERTQRG